MKLYTYFRSSAAFRVRIALNLKGLRYEPVFVHLAKGEHRQPQYAAVNPQGLLPTLELDDGKRLTQSLAIIEWLEEKYPVPALLPKDAFERARVRSLSYLVASEIHPLNNLRVLQHLKRALGRARSRSTTGTVIGSPTAWPSWKPSSRGPEAENSATAARQAWRTAAWCRRSSTPSATTAISRHTP